QLYENKSRRPYIL
uniref:Neurotensin n=2 Tax=Hystricomorpha TaxID=33550 RepID=NEUT_CAVPO|nr:RecName: Full=Neurotensin; Short=NT [Cavia porcellus]